MSFAGVSLIRDGRLWPSASATNDAGAASGYHLLVVEGYSRTKADVLTGKYIESRSFRVGGYLWFLKYYPNGQASGYADFISASLILAQDVATPVKAKRDDFENSEHLKDDSCTIRCDVVVIEDVNAKATASPFVTVPLPDMQRHFADLLASKEGADVTFKVGGEKFSAHRCVLAARSRVFKAELFGPMKEGASAAGAIHVEDMEVQVFRAILAFIYNDSEPELEKGDDEDVIWQQLLVAADRYDLRRLKLMCEDNLCGFINVNTTTAILALAERHGCDGLKKACYDFLATPGNVKAVVATDGFDHLISSFPSVVKELMVMLAP
ncbi:BTB/POZ and MATH domain-containing protein 2-like [Lolium rigidum]|uniref:BTB/POZ and MATH domain-containing protein 2-like n=1 Tax=Lolium rigidum TaxID=89674 RepID=UPI001F5CB5A6|nr:BTB/POZ and MATH domain-containing protein 2-like [Lolium rigidum]